MNKQDAKEIVLEAKKAKGVTWDAIGDAIGKSPVWTASACLGMNSFPQENAEKLIEFLGLDSALLSALTEYPTKIWDQAVPTDPLIYRLYEIVGVYGETLKTVIQEKFGDGIMSAIDFNMEVEKEENPAGDRVIVTMSGKFLPYKTW